MGVEHQFYIITLSQELRKMRRCFTDRVAGNDKGESLKRACEQMMFKSAVFND